MAWKCSRKSMQSKINPEQNWLRKEIFWGIFVLCSFCKSWCWIDNDPAIASIMTWVWYLAADCVAANWYFAKNPALIEGGNWGGGFLSLTAERVNNVESNYCVLDLTHCLFMNSLSARANMINPKNYSIYILFLAIEWYWGVFPVYDEANGGGWALPAYREDHLLSHLAQTGFTFSMYFAI